MLLKVYSYLNEFKYTNTNMKYLKKRIKKNYNLDYNNITKIASFPKNALIELTNGCNHACVFCKNSNQSRRATKLPINKYKNFIKQASELGLEEVGLYSTGEPYMTKNLNDYISIAKQYGVKRIYLTTNGSLANLNKVITNYEAGLNSIKFSINAANKEDYIFIHGQDDFDKVVKNVKEIYNWKEKNNINLQMLASCVMITSIPNMQEEHYSIFKSYFEDINYVKANSQLGQAFSLIDDLAVSPHGIFNNLDKENSRESIKPCAMIWNRYHLTAESYLSACCVDYELDLIISDLNKEKLKDAWNNSLATNLRQAHLTSNLEGLLCDQCMHNRKAPYKKILEVNELNKSNRILKKNRDNLKERIEIANKKIS